MSDRLRALVEDLERRAKKPDALHIRTNDRGDAARQARRGGKSYAYRHAANLLRQVLEAEQPTPIGGTGDVWLEILDHHGEDHPLHEAMANRRQLGIEHYGVPLGYGDGRDEVRDALEEALDLAAYLWRLGRRWPTAYGLSDAIVGIAITIDQWRERG